MTFDDEQLDPNDESGSKPAAPTIGIIDTVFKSMETAPLEATMFQVMVEVTANNSAVRHGVDFVTVLDVSGSMRTDNKIGKMKDAMKFLIYKLTPIDRLSIVVFGKGARRVSRLRVMNDKSKEDLLELVQGLSADDPVTDIKAGLVSAIQVLRQRNLKNGRMTAIMLMSDGKETAGTKAADVNVTESPVYTFGFGGGDKNEDYDSNVLNDIAFRSRGTFALADVTMEHSGSLNQVFSTCLAGLLQVAVQNLIMVIKPVKIQSSTITRVSAETYKTASNAADGSVTFSFGDLYIKEVRKVVVNLQLPAIPTPSIPQIVQVGYTYNVNTETETTTVISHNVRRIRTSSNENENDDLRDELTRIDVAEVVKRVRTLANNKQLDEAADLLADLQNKLYDLKPNDVIDTLKLEVDQLLNYVADQQSWDKNGLAYANSFVTSHERQRYAARGDMENARMFATPNVAKMYEQAKCFEKDSKPPPTAADDEKEEFLRDPLSKIRGPLAYSLDMAIKSLQDIRELLICTNLN